MVTLANTNPAYTEGYQGFYSGVTIHKNPFERLSDEFLDWSIGWSSAWADAEIENQKHG